MGNIKLYVKTWKLWGIEDIPRSFLNFEEEYNSDDKVKPDRETISWDALKNEILSCKLCYYHKHRKNVVIGEGYINAKVMLIGEAPWVEEDRQGRPFVGKAGKLLTKMLKYINVDRKDIYIANVVKCLPPQRRAPEEEIIHICSPYLLKQIELINPLIILTLGRVATHFLLKTRTPISRMRGNWYKWNGIWVLPTFHPSYILQNPGKAKLAAEDMKLLYKKMKELGVV